MPDIDKEFFICTERAVESLLQQQHCICDYVCVDGEEYGRCSDTDTVEFNNWEVHACENCLEKIKELTLNG